MPSAMHSAHQACLLGLAGKNLISSGAVPSSFRSGISSFSMAQRAACCRSISCSSCPTWVRQIDRAWGSLHPPTASWQGRCGCWGSRAEPSACLQIQRPENGLIAQHCGTHSGSTNDRGSAQHIGPITCGGILGHGFNGHALLGITKVKVLPEVLSMGPKRLVLTLAIRN